MVLSILRMTLLTPVSYSVRVSIYTPRRGHSLYSEDRRPYEAFSTTKPTQTALSTSSNLNLPTPSQEP